MDAYEARQKIIIDARDKKRKDAVAKHNAADLERTKQRIKEREIQKQKDAGTYVEPKKPEVKPVQPSIKPVVPEKKPAPSPVKPTVKPNPAPIPKKPDTPKQVPKMSEAVPHISEARGFI